MSVANHASTSTARWFEVTSTLTDATVNNKARAKRSISRCPARYDREYRTTTKASVETRTNMALDTRSSCTTSFIPESRAVVRAS